MPKNKLYLIVQIFHERFNTMKKSHILGLISALLLFATVIVCEASDQKKMVVKVELATSPAIVVASGVIQFYIAEETGEVIINPPPEKTAKATKGFIKQVFHPPVNDPKKFRLTNYSEDRA